MKSDANRMLTRVAGVLYVFRQMSDDPCCDKLLVFAKTQLDVSVKQMQRIEDHAKSTLSSGKDAHLKHTLDDINAMAKDAHDCKAMDEPLVVAVRKHAK